MLKTVNGVRCNTLTAKPLAMVVSGDDTSNPGYFCETLYVNKFHNFFIHGVGGASSRYATQPDGRFQAGEDILALSYDEASAWASKNLPEASIPSFFATAAQCRRRCPRKRRA